MIDVVLKEKQKAEWLKTHTLTPDQFKQLIQNKLVRAEASHYAMKKREALVKRR